MSSLRYSVVIPTFNRAGTIGRALASVDAQTLPAAEVIVVDDGSTDDTLTRLKGLSNELLRTISHTGNNGAAAARNTGAEAASSPWLAFLDSDDAWLPDKMSRQMSALAAPNSTARASVVGYRILDERRGHSETFVPSARDVTLDALANGCRLSPGSTLVVSRNVYLELGGLDTALPRLEDWDWLIRYSAHYTLAAVSEPLAVVHKGSDPSYAQVKAAVARLGQLHRDFWYRRSWSAGRNFDSTLLIEEAAGALYAGDRTRAIRLTLRALATYPFRGAPFYAKLVRLALKRPGQRDALAPTSSRTARSNGTET